jgi:hypothetical protein
VGSQLPVVYFPVERLFLHFHEPVSIITVKMVRRAEPLFLDGMKLFKEENR